MRCGAAVCERTQAQGIFHGTEQSLVWAAVSGLRPRWSPERDEKCTLPMLTGTTINQQLIRSTLLAFPLTQHSTGASSGPAGMCHVRVRGRTAAVAAGDGTKG
jgi:hypothetical protein